MKKLGLILALTMVVLMTIGVSAALAVPGEYTDTTDYKNGNLPESGLTGSTLDSGEGTKKSVVFGVTPTTPGAARPDGTNTETNANKSNTRLGNTAVSPTFDNIAPPASNQFVHGQFQKNTNSCASCHMTHTAAGDALLVQNGIYNTCSACHDGTLGKLNVFDTTIAYDAAIPAAKFDKVGGGSFGGDTTLTTQNASMHLPTGYLELAAAPGGNRTKAATDVNGNAAETGSWTGDFTCASCHQPHGSYSDRLLAPNPANIERQAVTVADWVYDSADGLYKAWANKDADPELEQIEGPWVFGESYSPGYTQTVFYYAEDAVGANALNTNSTPMLPKAVQLNEDFAVNYAKGIGKANPTFTPDPAKTLKVAIVPALVVKVERGFFVKNDGTAYELNVTDADATNDDYLQGLDGSVVQWTGEYKFSNPLVATRNNYGKNGITWFCAGCHTDYYSDKFKNATAADGTTTTADLEGKYSSAFRHTINRGALEEPGQPPLFIYETGVSHGAAGPVLTCLGCHYAHGTYKDIMRNADDTQAAAPDVNASSAIKRFVNMSVCWKCHTSQHGDELANSNSYYSDINVIREANGFEAIPQ
ncbi:MAG: cytochrome c3 family protein [Bacillota bacterium]